MKTILTIFLVLVLVLAPTQQSDAVVNVPLVPAVVAMVVIGVVVGTGIYVYGKVSDIAERQRCEECGRTVEDKDGNVPPVCPFPDCETPIPHTNTAYSEPEDHPCYPYIGSPGCMFPPFGQYNSGVQTSGSVSTATTGTGTGLIGYPPEPWDDTSEFPYYFPHSGPVVHNPTNYNWHVELQWSTDLQTWTGVELPDGMTMDPVSLYELEVQLKVFEDTAALNADTDPSTAIPSPMQIAGTGQALFFRMAEVSD